MGAVHIDVVTVPEQYLWTIVYPNFEFYKKQFLLESLRKTSQKIFWYGFILNIQC